MHTASSIEAYRGIRGQWAGQTVAFVPTMGALHEGHLSLIRQAKALGDRVVVSIFVNPLQFGPNEDLSKYPKTLEQDLKRCEAEGVDLVFIPTEDVLYPEGPESVTKVIPPPELTETLCGKYRPGHFTGVATVVIKLFDIVKPDIAVFGEKDAQQLAVIQRVVNDLNLAVKIVPHPTVRDTNGLALSSRNRYLQSPEALETALAVPQILRRIREQARQSGQPLDAQATLKKAAQDVIGALNGKGQAFRLEYLEAVDKHTFEPAETLTPESKVLIAAYVNDVRLIDNLDMA